MKRVLCVLLLVCIFLTGCASGQKQQEKKQYNASFLTLFDTLTTVVGKAESEESFRATSQSIHDALLEYHQLFDIYNEYEGVTNLKNVNDQAGVAPVKVDEKIIRLLLDCKEMYEATGKTASAGLFRP